VILNTGYWKNHVIECLHKGAEGFLLLANFKEQIQPFQSTLILFEQLVNKSLHNPR